MKIGESKVIAERETGNDMNGMSWSEYLVLEKLKKGQFRLDIRRNEVIEETHYYCSENELIDDDGNMTIPTKIDGQEVYEDDGYLYGYNLVRVDDCDAEVIFATPEQGSIVDWCKKHKWDYDRIVKSLVEECSGSKQSSKKKPIKKRSAPKPKKTPKTDRSLSPEQVKMINELYKLKVSTYKKSSEDGEK
jgi:hypothetical protein